MFRNSLTSKIKNKYLVKRRLVAGSSRTASNAPGNTLSRGTIRRVIGNTEFSPKRRVPIFTITTLARRRWRHLHIPQRCVHCVSMSGFHQRVAFSENFMRLFVKLRRRRLPLGGRKSRQTIMMGGRFRDGRKTSVRRPQFRYCKLA